MGNAYTHTPKTRANEWEKRNVVEQRQNSFNFLSLVLCFSFVHCFYAFREMVLMLWCACFFFPLSPKIPKWFFAYKRYNSGTRLTISMFIAFEYRHTKVLFGYLAPSFSLPPWYTLNMRLFLFSLRYFAGFFFLLFFSSVCIFITPYCSRSHWH